MWMHPIEDRWVFRAAEVNTDRSIVVVFGVWKQVEGAALYDVNDYQNDQTWIQVE
jgi:hypothetical protein